MKVVVFGLAMSSSWGNGHATLWRGLVRALARRGHHVTFFERDLPFYAANRDLHDLPGGELVIYPDWDSVADRARRAVAEADVAMVTSYCPDAPEAERLVVAAPRAARLFYDLDTPVTLAALEGPERPAYVGARGFADYDLVLSYTGGAALAALRDRLGARRVAPLYGHVDPDVHRPATPDAGEISALTYLGTYAADRQPALERLFVVPARLRPERRFTLGGAQYPADFPWTPNIFFRRHLPPAAHPAFFAAGRMTLNVTRAAMAAMGHCPSGRLFEAAACGTALLSDGWEGLDDFFVPGSEILVADTTESALAALDLSDAAVARIAQAGRARVLADHTSDRRALDFEAAVASLAVPQGEPN
ncbi:glycosyltransferase [Lichenihabitans sp. Uapishka_5]|uniref:CgeB family protein n=1 Tax=Lichenihabitans sp. Uapishka_5 TaxID=3037302 RepID=UPI0029E813DD|nr:glycosyltransferase [Lichenihabitans sp. Uapishka_5]MDX7952502.1 glycosyltransferase [Lichenihabitans sp. Uapishka_5]